MSHDDERLVRQTMQTAAVRPPAGPCPDAELLALYADRGLDGDELDSVEAHVAGCTRCQATVAALVRSAPEEHVAGAADDAETGGAWWTGWRWLVPAGATAAVLALAVWIGRTPSQEAAPVQVDTAASAALEPATRPLGAGDAAAVVPPGASPQTAPPPPAPAPARDFGGNAAARAAAESEARREAPPSAAAQLQRAGQAPVPAASADTLANARPVEEAAAVTGASPAPPLPTPSAAAPAEARQKAAPAPAAVAPAPEPGLSAQRDAASAERARTGAEPPAVGGVAAGAPALLTARAEARLSGRVTYRTREALPAGAVVEVRLLDVSLADAPAEMLGRVEVVTKGEQVPIPFTVRYDAGAVDERRRYTLQVTIAIGGRVAYRSTTAHTVLTGGAPTADVEVVVERMR